jgi:arylsulfatase A-like enzyme
LALRWRRLAFTGLAACALALAGAGCAREPFRPRHVFLVTVDTLRADHLGSYGYGRATSPRLDAAATDGVLFEQAIVQWPKTGPSFASMFTGQYPQTTGLTHEAALRVPEAYLTLPELFRELGFTTVAVVSNHVLDDELGWDAGFEEYLETWRGEEGVSHDPVVYRKGINAVRVNELALPLLARHRDATRLFAWIHYSDPHAPYILPDGYENPFLGDRFYVGDEIVEIESPRATALGERRDRKFYVAQYDANVHLADLHIGELLEHLDRLGLLEGSLVVFTADHGESLGEHGYCCGHGRLPYNQSARVPLIFYAPGHLPAAVRVALPVELVDLYPTLLDLVAPGREVAGLEGTTLGPLLAAGPPAPEVAAQFRWAFSEAGGGSPLTHFRSVQGPTWKLVYHPARKVKRQARPILYELYDLEADPGETRDVKEAHPEVWRELRGVLFEWMKGSEWIRRPRGFVEEHSEEMKKALKALGYLP